VAQTTPTIGIDGHPETTSLARFTRAKKFDDCSFSRSRVMIEGPKI